MIILPNASYLAHELGFDSEVFYHWIKLGYIRHTRDDAVTVIGQAKITIDESEANELRRLIQWLSANEARRQLVRRKYHAVTANEAEQLTGISERTLHNWAAQGFIPTVDYSDGRLIPLTEVARLAAIERGYDLSHTASHLQTNRKRIASWIRHGWIIANRLPNGIYRIPREFVGDWTRLTNNQPPRKYRPADIAAQLQVECFRDRLKPQR